jgi:ribA/ribD-fused uncharacterized protein
MFDEVPVTGSKYNFGDWTKYAVHDENVVRGFFGQYRWLSNFHECQVLYGGLIYNSVENAYQAAKVAEEHRSVFTICPPYKSKKLWKQFPRVDASAAEWDARKLSVMKRLIAIKFCANVELMEKLLSTGDKYLEETNHWGDSYWGFDIRKGGDNYLGDILMSLRDFIKA